MFGHRYFGAAFYGPRYFGPVPAAATQTGDGLAWMIRRRRRHC